MNQEKNNLQEAPEIPICPSCGQVGEPGMDLCWNCGQSMDSNARVIHTKELESQADRGRGRMVFFLVFLFVTGLMVLAGWIRL